jgi:hypothetical protein
MECPQSEMIGEAAYGCEWFAESVTLQNSIVVIIMRAQRPARLSVGPFGTLSLELFGRVCNTPVLSNVFIYWGTSD